MTNRAAYEGLGPVHQPRFAREDRGHDGRNWSQQQHAPPAIRDARVKVMGRNGTPPCWLEYPRWLQAALRQRA
jgi:hypothetical protein